MLISRINAEEFSKNDLVHLANSFSRELLQNLDKQVNFEIAGSQLFFSLEDRESFLQEILHNKNDLPRIRKHLGKARSTFHNNCAYIFIRNPQIDEKNLISKVCKIKGIQLKDIVKALANPVDSFQDWTYGRFRTLDRFGESIGNLIGFELYDPDFKGLRELLGYVGRLQEISWNVKTACNIFHEDPNKYKQAERDCIDAYAEKIKKYAIEQIKDMAKTDQGITIMPENRLGMEMFKTYYDTAKGDSKIFYRYVAKELSHYKVEQKSFRLREF